MDKCSLLVLDGVTLGFSLSTKYLGTILDQRSWIWNMEEGRNKRSHGALCMLTWGLRAQVQWLYVTVVLPVFTYGCLVWWHAIEVAYVQTNCRNMLMLN